MKKLIVASAAVVAAALFPGNAFAIPGGHAKSIEAPGASVKVKYRAHRPRHCYRAYHCGGYYSTYVYASPCGGYTYSSSGGCGCGGGWGGGFFGGIFGW